MKFEKVSTHLCKCIHSILAVHFKLGISRKDDTNNRNGAYYIFLRTNVNLKYQHWMFRVGTNFVYFARVQIWFISRLVDSSYYIYQHTLLNKSWMKIIPRRNSDDKSVNHHAIKCRIWTGRTVCEHLVFSFSGRPLQDSKYCNYSLYVVRIHVEFATPKSFPQNKKIMIVFYILYYL